MRRGPYFRLSLQFEWFSEISAQDTLHRTRHQGFDSLWMICGFL